MYDEKPWLYDRKMYLPYMSYLRLIFQGKILYVALNHINIIVSGL